MSDEKSTEKPLPENAVKLLDDLWVVHEINNECIMKFEFLTFVRSDIDDTNIIVETLMHGMGVTGLRECRHTYWGDEGYIFYPDAKHIIAVMVWLSKHFDMD